MVNNSKRGIKNAFIFRRRFLVSSKKKCVYRSPASTGWNLYPPQVRLGPRVRGENCCLTAGVTGPGGKPPDTESTVGATQRSPESVG